MTIYETSGLKYNDILIILTYARKVLFKDPVIKRFL